MEDLNVLVKRRDEQQDALQETNSRIEELLAVTQMEAPPSLPTRDEPRSPAGSGSQTTLARPPWRHHSIGLDTVFTSSASRVTGEGSDDEEDGEEYYVQAALETQQYDHDGLRQHLRSFKFSAAARTLLDGVVDNSAFLSRPTLFPTQKGPVADRSHLSHHQVFAVGQDGTPLPVELPESERPPSNALVIWNSIKDVNVPRPEHSGEQTTVGRITVVREPSPVLFGAVHYTMHRYFDVDELYRHLRSSEGSSASLHRAFDIDERRRRTFVFSFEYMTLIGEDCEPLPWQLSDSQKERKVDHIAITRCSAVVGLWLGGPSIATLKNRSRRAKGAAAHTYGYVHDPFGPWQVLNVQCYPDWKSREDVHDSTRHYVNGVEAFVVSLLGEFVDAEVRFEAILHQITTLVTPPLDFMFNADVRERLLFEDAAFTYVRRYFWAMQTLGIIKNSIKAMVDAYEDNFTDEVWTGNHKTLWPLQEENRPRNVHFRKKMSTLRTRFDQQVVKLKNLIGEIDDRRAEIQNLREELFVGTSIQESRKSVENSDITVQQGHNIKILTMVSIFFLPLTFVTSVFGMTNMPTDEHYWQFGIVTACVCVPFFILVGSLNTTRGLHFWRHKVATAAQNLSGWIFRHGRPVSNVDSESCATEDARSSYGSPISPSASARAIRSTRHTRKQARHMSMDTASSRTTSELRRPGAETRPSLTGQPTSQLASMIVGDVERRRTVTYGPDVPRGLAHSA